MTGRELRRAIGQGLLLAPLLLAMFVGVGAARYVGVWDSAPQWHEAWRHAHRPYVAIERWIRFRWVHHDSQYWIVPVRLDQGPVVLEGAPPDALYWSVTWYEWTEVNPSISSQSIELESDGSYRIVMSVEPQPGNWLPVRDGVDRAVVYLRAYEPRHQWPVTVPSVSRHGTVLARGGAL